MTSPTLQRLKKVLGIDFHVATTLLFRGWSIAAGALMVLVLPATLDPQQQGYYFTFASLLALQIFFELGLNQVIVQLVSHEMAYLTVDSSGGLSGDALKIDRLSSIIAKLRRWYRIAAVLFAIVTATIGIVFFERAGTLPMQQWLGPWLLLVLATAMNLYCSPMLAVIEGSGHVGHVARLRLVQSLVGYGLTWAALFMGAGLWAMPLIPIASIVFTAVWLSADRSLLRAFDAIGPISHDRAINWRTEVLPFQWRIAVSWVSGYLLHQLFTPLAFVHLGAVAAGRLGIALAVFNSVLSVGVSWINAKVPALTAHITRGEREARDQVFFGVLKRATLFCTAASLAVVVAVQILQGFDLRQLDRIADLPTLACLAVLTSVNALIYSAAAYMRAHREEPMLPVSVVSGLLTLGCAYFASRQGTFPIMLCQAALTVLITLPWTLSLFQSYRRRDAA